MIIMWNIPISLRVNISWEISAWKDPTVQEKLVQQKSYDGKFVTAKCSSINYRATLNMKENSLQIMGPAASVSETNKNGSILRTIVLRAIEALE